MGIRGIRLLSAIVAAAAAGLCMYVLRVAAQVRSVPERLLEWSLMLAPPGAFETVLMRFGFDTKRYALWATTLAMLLILAAIGYLMLERRWSVPRLLAGGVALWLMLMLVLMPLTDAGVFASALIDGGWSAMVGYFATCLAYVSVLAVASLAFESRPVTPIAERRAALVGVAGSLAGLLGVLLVPLLPRQTRRESLALDPQQPVPSGGIDAPAPHPDVVAVGAEDTSQEVPTAAPQTTARPEFPEPRPPRPMKRDREGAVVPAGRRQGELTDLITSNDDFYIVTKNAGGDPFLRASEWRLVVDGDVQQRIELGYAALRALPSVEVTKTLECISNLVAQCHLAPFGCDLISNARWRGVRLVDVLQLAGGPKPEATHLTTISADEYTTALPLQVALDPETLLIFEMNGEVLPREHGYPVRLLVPGRYGMKNAKWLIGVRPTTREVLDWYGQRHWSKDGTVRTMTRIDVPTPGATLQPGDYNIAGIAYAGERGIRGVEFSADGGMTWRQADLLEAPLGRDAWVRWIGRFHIDAATSLSLVSRATDGTGALQVEEFGLAQPDGATGWHRIEVSARAT